MRRTCSRCHRLLWGKRGHGFPSESGREILCPRCSFWWLFKKGERFPKGE